MNDEKVPAPLDDGGLDELREALAALLVETKRKYRTRISTPAQVGAVAVLDGLRAVPEVAAAVRELASEWALAETLRNRG